ncbi:hypothetical protein EVAR_11530_1 [Eumeta japonica]|uniref:Uncharacterized protein n=1 Tax=Eumeta variegata TaxID=151549 RepID=A0A4C1TZ53_EUMVA|nr:hypothetical protein EVAR_11530_1 [Eumeta japonica]
MVGYETELTPVYIIFYTKATYIAYNDSIHVHPSKFSDRRHLEGTNSSPSAKSNPHTNIPCVQMRSCRPWGPFPGVRDVGSTLAQSRHHSTPPISSAGVPRDGRRDRRTRELRSVINYVIAFMFLRNYLLRLQLPLSSLGG